MKDLRNLVGKVIAEKVNESAELQLLLYKLHSSIEALTSDESTINYLDELFEAILIQAQIDSKFDGFLSGIDFPFNET